MSPSDGYWDEQLEIQCPYCGERIEVAVSLETWGSLVQDCEVCCNPIQLTVKRDRYGDADVRVERAQD